MRPMAKGFLGGLKKGALHKDLGINLGKKIPVQDLEVKPDDSPLLEKRKVFAQNASHWNKS